MDQTRIKKSQLLAVLSLAALLVLCGPQVDKRAGAITPGPASQPSSLSAVYHDDFLIGTAMDINGMAAFSPEELAIIKTQFNVITPENSMKPASIHPAEDRWNWGPADQLVTFCQENKIQIVGHCLAWHAQTAPWFFVGDNGQPVSREKAIERLRQHIMTELGRYKGKIKGWDVVNEAISDNGPGDTENLRSSAWVNAIGPDYINFAFKFAHEADPNAELYYNDYSIEGGNKHKSSLLLLKRLIHEGVPITAVGIQGHWSLNYLPYKQLDDAISDYQALGLKVNITELDITIVGQGGGQLTPNNGAPTTRPGTQPGVGRPPRRGRGLGQGPAVVPTSEQLEAQATAYKKFFELFLKHKDVIERVTIWGLNDARSWRRGQAPLLFDGSNKPKPAFFAVVAAKK